MTLLRPWQLLMGNKALPTRFSDVEFFPSDKLDVKFSFKNSSGDPIDVSLSSFLVTVTSNNHDDLEQPVVDMAEAEDGLIWIRWTSEQTAVLPRFFSMEIAESGGFNEIDDVTWDELPEDTWDEFDEVTWDSVSIWDRTILVGRFIRNTYGQYQS